MKRNLDLCRALLLHLEQQPANTTPAASNIVMPPWSSDEIVYNCLMLQDAGYIDAVDSSTMCGDDMLIRRLTVHGHDYLDAVRNETIWSAVKQKLRIAGVDATLDIAKATAVALAAAALKL